MSESAPSPHPTVKPLQGIRIIDVSSFLAGPFCSTQLAEFGAEVWKLELPGVGDALRKFGTMTPSGDSLPWLQETRNKKVATLDLRKPEGAELLKRMIRKADVLVENFQPGTLEKWGLGWEALSAINPRLVMVRISGFGQDGPYSQRPGYGVVCEAVSGLRHLTGDPDRAPSRVGVSMTDYIAGLHGAYGAVMALMAREHTGRGQVIDTALYESAFNFMEVWIGAYQKLGFVPNREGSRLIGSTPNNLYPTADGSYIHITAMADSLFRRLCDAMGQPALARDPRFAEHAGRNDNHAALDVLIARWTATLPLAEIEAVLDKVSVPATRIFTVADIFADPHYSARRSIIEAPDQHLGTVAMPAVVPRLSDTPGAVRHAGRDVGQDSRAVLREVLALNDERIDALTKEGIVTA